MATVDNDAAVEWTAQWADALTHLQIWDSETGGTFKGELALATAISPTLGATVRIPTGDLDAIFTPASGIEDSLVADFLGEIGSGVDLWFGWGTATGSTNEVTVTGYARQQPDFS